MNDDAIPSESALGRSSRRRFLTSLSLTALAAGKLLADKTLHLGPKKKISRTQPIMPPGAFSIEKFSRQCTSCHLCVSKCPAQVIKPAFLEYGIGGMMQPMLDFKYQFCNYDCTICADVCPTGALTEKAMLGKARQWEVEKVTTTCPYCGVGCQYDLNVKDGKVIGVTSTDGDVNGRALCVKGRFGYGFIHHPDRLTTPLIKKDGEFVEATWDEAISLVAKKLGAAKDTYGPDAVALLSSARVTNEENYLMNKLARAVIGTNNIDHCARL